MRVQEFQWKAVSLQYGDALPVSIHFVDLVQRLDVQATER